MKASGRPKNMKNFRYFSDDGEDDNKFSSVCTRPKYYDQKTYQKIFFKKVFLWV